MSEVIENKSSVSKIEDSIDHPPSIDTIAAIDLHDKQEEEHMYDDGNLTSTNSVLHVQVGVDDKKDIVPVSVDSTLDGIKSDLVIAKNTPTQHLLSVAPQGPRRSSSRSIKRPKFDDELVDTSALKRCTSRKTSESSPSDPKLKRVIFFYFIGEMFEQCVLLCAHMCAYVCVCVNS